ncbi:hypothetical protein CRYUN_Cryun04dG0129500 [Craigia yunnanensis]
MLGQSLASMISVKSTQTYMSSNQLFRLLNMGWDICHLQKSRCSPQLGLFIQVWISIRDYVVSLLLEVTPGAGALVLNGNNGSSSQEGSSATKNDRP